MRAFLAVVLTLMASAGAALAQETETSDAGEAHVKVELRGVRDRVEIVRGEDGSYSFLLHTDEGEVRELTAEEFAERVYSEQSRQKWWNRLLNITSPMGIAWVAGQTTGWIIYLRNLWLIYRTGSDSPGVANDSGPGPEPVQS